MGQVRITEEGIQKRRDEISRLNTQIREHEAIQKEKDSALWKFLAPRIKESIEANKEKREALLNCQDGLNSSTDPMLDFANTKLLTGAIKAYQNVLGEVEVGQVIEFKRDRANRLTEELKRIAQEQGIN